MNKFLIIPVFLLLLLLMIFIVAISPFVAFVMPFKYYFEHKSNINPNYKKDDSMSTMMNLGKVFLSDLNKQNEKQV